MSGIYITVPEINSAAVAPLSVITNATITITVLASEIEKYLPPVYFYAGEILTGEN